ncbi:MAG: NAD-dependent epimerase/dehydratase family protein [Actinomycetota bacterium]
MRVLLTGATGFVGSSVLKALVAGGHEVTAVVRSQAGADLVTGEGATAVIHPLPDTEWLAMQLRDTDGFIHAATPEDDRGAFDDALLDAVFDAYNGTQKHYVHTGGVWVHGPGWDITEDTPINAPEATAWREPREQRVLRADFVGSVIEPGIVYGYGKGIPATITAAPKTGTGALLLVGGGDQHWTTIHVDDLADLYVKVLEEAPGGERYLGVNGDNPTVREIGLAVVGPDGEVAAEDEAASIARLGGDFARALFLDQQATGRKARLTFGWAPSRPSLVEELRAR